MPKASSRPSLPTSSTDFALPPSSSSPIASTSSLTLDDPNVLFQRFRRPSLLTPKPGYFSDSRLHSPLASSFTMHSRRRSHSLFIEESESDKERMLTDSSSASSENPTPPLKPPETREDVKERLIPHRPPLTPPRRLSSSSMDVQDSQLSPISNRRLSFPLKQPRIMSLLAESRPEENEVKSEAAFQRLISELPIQPRTPRVTTDRGRYPEEAGQEETQREDTPSDDDDRTDDTPFAFSAPGGSEPINIQKTSTPAGSVNGDDLGMSISETSSIGTAAMDVDMPPGSPVSSVISTPINHWRYTPPPTTSAVRSNKRKLEDRFDPYPSASKRRAVSPSLSYLRDIHPTIGSPISRNSRLPIAIPTSISGSTVNSAASSPTIGNSYPASYPRSVSMTSSPTLRPSMSLASPILRPVPRTGIGIRRGEEDEREVEGAGEAVNGLSLG